MKIQLNYLGIIAFAVYFLLFSSLGYTQNNDPISVDELLQKVKQGYRRDQQENQQRIEQFSQDRQQQRNLLADMKNQRAQAEAQSLQQEQQFEVNEQQITLLQERLTQRLGSLKELFGVLQLVANDTQGQFDNSLVQMHYPQRTAELNAFSEKMGQVTELPSVAEIEGLWFELQREMTESGKIVQSKQTVLLQNG